MNSTFASLTGLTLRPNEENITGDISNASMIDEEFTNINMMIKYFKYKLWKKYQEWFRLKVALFKNGYIKILRY